jgi:ATP-dependent metalloprotease
MLVLSAASVYYLLPKNKVGNALTSLLRDDPVEPERNVKARFEDVFGIDEHKEELQEIVDFLKNPAKYRRMGAECPKGLLLVGPPGTGKTLLARALAGEANCNLYYKSGSEFDEMFVGLGAKRVRNLFRQAKKNGPSIIFIDEIDSVAGRRSPNEPNHSKETINQLLTEMDGFSSSDNVVVIGATNFEAVLDPAIKRPGRFDKIVHIPKPDRKGREQLLRFYLTKIKHGALDLHDLAGETEGFTGADIENMVNISIIKAVKEGLQQASKEHFEYALERVLLGIKSSRKQS